MLKLKIFTVAGQKLALLRVAGITGGFYGNGNTATEALIDAFENYNAFILTN